MRFEIKNDIGAESQQLQNRKNWKQDESPCPLKAAQQPTREVSTVEPDIGTCVGTESAIIVRRDCKYFEFPQIPEIIQQIYRWGIKLHGKPMQYGDPSCLHGVHYIHHPKSPDISAASRDCGPHSVGIAQPCDGCAFSDGRSLKNLPDFAEIACHRQLLMHLL